MGYSLKELGNRNPVQISGAVMTLVNLPIIGQVWHPEPEFVSGLNIALVAVLGLFVVAKTVNTAKLEEAGAIVEDVAAEAAAGGFDDAVALAGAIEEQVTGKVAETLEAVALLTVPPVVPAPAPSKRAGKKAPAKKRAAARG